MRAKHRGKAIIAGVDACQRLQGIPNKLLAFERLLDEFPEHRGRAVMVERVMIPSVRVDDVASTRDEVTRLIARIRAKHGDECIDYAESSALPRASTSPLGLSQRVALWMVADVLLQTPIREGLSLNSLEYIFVSMQGALFISFVCFQRYSFVCSSILLFALFFCLLYSF